MTEYEGFVCAPGDVGKIAVVVSKFNRSITDRLLEGALAKFRENMVSDDQIVVARVPGAFELPTLAERFAIDEEFAAVVCLGCVIKGETPHDEYINAAVSQQLARIGAEYCLPVVFGLLTCNTLEQALARSGAQEVGKDKALGEQPGNKGAEAAEVALEMLDLFGKLPEVEIDASDGDDFRSIERNSKRYFNGEFEDVDVNPDELVDLDDEEDENDSNGDMSWLVRGGARERRRDANSDQRRAKKPSFGERRGSDSSFGSRKRDARGASADKRGKSGGAASDKKRKKQR